nr:helix-turn-helix transcriptional regulator [uncultured Draconibacterium sp.]
MNKTIAKEHICIDKILQKKKLKKTDLAKRLGINRQTLYSYMEGNITLENIIKIAKALEVETWELFNKSEHEVSGFIEFKGEVYRINSKNDLEILLSKM